MTSTRLVLVLPVAFLLSACENKSPDSTPGTTTASTSTAQPSASVAASAPSVPADPSVTVGHIRVTIKKVSVGRVPLKAADGTTTYSDEPRLMVALRIENLSDKTGSKYTTWVPDLEAAKTIAKLTVNGGPELKRVSLGFGNNVKDRTATDDLTPGKVISDLLLFEVPPINAASLRLELPGANVSIKDSFVFQIETATIKR
ncbi:MAG TPA: hypothetical protein VHR66_32220 [Gemmataceae bacterium]|jgi:hypothetical protein|nr:hypothetical protein [Gemmataceae bacterium]